MRYKVLVADDEFIIRRGIIGFLKKFKEIEITAEAENGEIALELVKNRPLDILFVDINMPILNGLQFIEQLRKVQPNAAVVVITGYDDFEYARQALRLQVKEYILKPLMEEVFDSAVRRILQILGQKIEEERYLHWAQNMVEKNKRYFVYEFMIDWMEGHLSREEAEEKIEYLELKIPEKYILSMIHVEYTSRQDVDSLWDMNLLHYAAENIVMEVFEGLEPISVSIVKHENLILITKQVPADKLEVLNRKVQMTIEKYLPAKITILQEKGESHHEIPDSYLKLLESEEQLKACPGSIKEIQQFIEKNYNKEELSLLDAARHINISPQHLSRMFKKEMGVTFVDYLTKVRIRKSLELLAVEDMKIYEVAEKVGYSTQHYFSSVFKKSFGISPIEYRKNLIRE